MKITSVEPSAVRGQFTWLTIILLTLAFCSSAIDRPAVREIIVGIGFSVLGLFAIWNVRAQLRVLTVVLALPPLIGHWLLQLSGHPLLRALVFGLTTAFLAYLTVIVMIAVFRHDVVTADTIVGAVCADLLIGMTWGTAYALLVSVSPDALAVSAALANTGQWRPPSTSFIPLLQYYSFSTLATIGFGDISPITSGARALSIFEGLTGQLYLAVLIARLVGLHTARHQPPP